MSPAYACPLHMAVRLAPPPGSCQANLHRGGMKNGADYVSVASHDAATPRLGAGAATDVES